MKKIYLTLLVFMTSMPFFAHGEWADSVANRYQLEEVIIHTSGKETNNLKTLPTAVSIITPQKVKSQQIVALKDLSGFVPNMYIPDYGSRMTSAIYIRGIGARSSGQSIGMYVDNVPYMDKSTFDFDMMDIQRIEVLRGPQGTLYGRNAMGGLVNVYTKSPLDYQGTTVQLGGGMYGFFRGQVSTYQSINDRLGISFGGYYNWRNGFFTNRYDGKKVDEEENAGGKVRLEYKINDRWKLDYTTRFDYVDQGAFPYGLYNAETQRMDAVNYNDPGSYNRQTLTNSLSLAYRGEKFLFTSTTAYQYYKDKMVMDQDYSPLSIFTLRHSQRQHSVNEEIAFRSKEGRNYQWSIGAFGFYNSLKTNAPVTFKEDGITTILQPVFDKIHQQNPQAPVITITDEETRIPGSFDTPVWGVALFHQSTYNDLFVDGLSATAGLRFDYEKTMLDYNTTAQMHLKVKPNGMPFAIPLVAIDTLSGQLTKDFWQVMPRFSLKYAFDDSRFLYFSVSRGYKTGGYNIQMFSDLVQESMMSKYANMSGGNTPSTALSVEDAVSYDPENTWNYELGSRWSVVKDKLNLEVALFYIDVDKMQLTKFVPSGRGRMIVNAGKATSKGVELSLSGEPLSGLSYSLNYGLTHATFDRYVTNVKDETGVVIEKDYKGNYIPFAPRNTLTAGLSYLWDLERKWMDFIRIDAQYLGAGKIYWTEQNDVTQDYYSTLNGKLTFVKDRFELSFWGKNLLDARYATFYFESRNKGYGQMARPLQAGVDLVVTF